MMLPWFLICILVLVVLGPFSPQRYRRKRKHHPPAFEIAFFSGGIRIYSMNLKVSQRLPLNIKAVDKFGNPTGAIDSDAWDVVDSTLGSLVVSDDGLSAMFTPSGKVGDTEVHVAAVVGGLTIDGRLSVSLMPGDAVSIEIQAGAPEDIPVDVPAVPAP